MIFLFHFEFYIHIYQIKHLSLQRDADYASFFALVHKVEEKFLKQASDSYRYRKQGIVRTSFSYS
jgi:hypothetical protein